MIEVEQNDLVQHKHSKNVYRVVNTDKTTGKSERVRIWGITITQFDLVKFKSKETVSVSFPIKFSHYKPLETID